jgi:hypothetical protein
MAPPQTSDPTKFDFSTFSPWVAAIVAAGGAFALFEGKLERMRALRNETGRWEAGFIGFYVVPQWVLIILSGLVVLLLGAACIDVIQPNVMAGLPLIGFARAAFEIHNIAWTVAGAAVLAIIIRWNWIPRLLLLFGRLLSILPAPGLQQRFGPNGNSIGWHQAKAVCEGPDKGAPLLIKGEDLDRVARIVLTRLSQNGAPGAGDKNYAATPIGLSPSVKANMALFGCIMEVNVGINRWPKPDWAPFYAALADVQAANSMFEPAVLVKFGNGNRFFEEFRVRFDAALSSRSVTPPPNNSLQAAGDVVHAWERLTQKAKGDLLLLPPWWAGLFGSKVGWLDRRLRAFPRMNSDGMRPQLLKLLTRWGCIPETDGPFVQPFSKTLAWLLLQEGALAALPETKEVTFNIFGQAAVARLAMKAVLQRVSELIVEGASTEAKNVAMALGDSTWRRFEAGDFALWSWSYDERKLAEGKATGSSTPWDKSKWRWKLDDDRVVRQS